MSLRVNMLKEDEIRYYSAIRKDFAIRTGVFAVLGILTLLLLLFIFQIVNTKKALVGFREQWADVEPRYRRYEEISENLKVNREMLQELDEWQQMSLSWPEPLLILQGLIPETVQLNAMDMRNTIGAEVSRRTLGEGDKAKELITIKPNRVYRMILQGVATGVLADETVVQLVKTIKEDPSLSLFFDKVKLQAMQRSTVGGEGDRAFTIDIVSIPIRGDKS